MAREFVTRNGLISLDNSQVTGSLSVSGGITGSLFGTASWAVAATTASFVQNAVSASFASTASFVNPLRQIVTITGSSTGYTANDYVLLVNHSGSANPANVATFKNSTSNGVRISLVSSDRSFQISTNGNADGGSIIGNLNISSGTPTLRLMNSNETTTLLSLSANTTTGVITATTSASSAPIILQNNGLTTTGSLNVNGNITGSNILTTGTITAQTIVAQVITSSTDFVTGSTRFGSLLTNTHQFTGSVSVTGSLTVTGATSSLLVNELVVGPSGGSPKISFVGTGFGSYIQSDGYIISYNTRQTDRAHIFRQAGTIVARIGTQDSAGADAFEIFRGSGLVESFAISSSGEVRVNTTTGLGYQFDVNGTGNFRNNVTITGSLVVAPSSNRELVVSSTGVSIGNTITDTHTVTGSVRLSGSMEVGPTLSNSLAQLLVTGTPTRTKGIIVSSSWDYQSSWAIQNGIYSSEFNLGGATKNTSEGGPGSFQISLYNSSTATYRYPFTSYANGNVFIGGSSTSIPTDTGQALQVAGAGKFTGGLTVTGSLIAPAITGSLQGTASWAQNSISSSYAVTASYALNGGGGGSSTTVTYNRVTASYTLALTDAGKTIEVSGSTATTYNITVPAASTTNFDDGTYIDVILYGTGSIQFVTASGVTFRSANNWTKLGTRYGAATLLNISGDEWYIVGNLNAQ